MKQVFNKKIGVISLGCDKNRVDTEKMLAILPEVRTVSREWRALLSEGIPEEELAIFYSVLERMQTRAREIIEKQEESK